MAAYNAGKMDRGKAGFITERDAAKIGGYNPTERNEQKNPPTLREREGTFEAANYLPEREERKNRHAVGVTVIVKRAIRLPY